ncbi:MAG TPA: Flp family type IVb pilin [Alphaproteobacteria bacterium]|nr:Flp family type IVb pilin [Alphaproteobacteria bacterium]
MPSIAPTPQTAGAATPTSVGVVMEEAMVRILSSFVRDENGATMIEYGLIAALVSVVAIAALGQVGGNLTSMYTHVADCLSQAQSGSSC